MRTTVTKKIHDPDGFKAQMLQWAQQFEQVVYLDSNNYRLNHSDWDAVLAVDAFVSLRTDYTTAWEHLSALHEHTNDWLFGYLSYDLKNGLEKLSSSNHDGLGFADLYFFQPKKLYLLRGNELQIAYLHLCDDEIERDFNHICRTEIRRTAYSAVSVRQRLSQSDYIIRVEKMLAHIQRGDIYEANFCMEYFANATINPLETYRRLNDISKPPFAAFARLDEGYILSASPERYLKKQGRKLISQPIKGTASRHSDPEMDKLNKAALVNNPKERAENVMIVDLVRNDLSRVAAKDSVQVPELCAAYTFEQVHHLISTITATLAPDVSPVEAIRASFPMGSMTGAPKISAMNIIESLEETKRGVYSGALGYFTPDGDFDFNVIIRSILYNEAAKYVSFSVGSAVTAQANPAQEYEECRLKAQAMLRALQ